MHRKRTVSFTIRSLSNIIRRRIDDLSDVAVSGMTGMHGAIIGFVCGNLEQGRDVFQRDIEREFKIRRSTATGILKLMEKNGLLTRVPISGDGRMKKIILTDKAMATFELIDKHMRHIDEMATKGLTEEEIAAFYDITDKIRANLESKN